VKTLLSSGNVVFDARSSSEAAIEKKAEAAMKNDLGVAFLTFARSQDSLKALVESDPFQAFRIGAKAKRIVTFLRTAPESTPQLPIKLDGATILAVKGRQVFTAYTPSPRGPVFMTLIQRTFGKDITTRTWDTVKKVAKA
jgi:uncharacterized protein (DUF1697 family)